MLAVLLLAAVALGLAREKWRYFETSTVPCRSGHGGRRTIASVAKVAATNPINSPISAIRVLSTAGTQDASPSLMTNTPTGFAVRRRSASSAPGLVLPRTLATGSDRHSVHGFVRLPVDLRSGRVRHDRVEGIS